MRLWRRVLRVGLATSYVVVGASTIVLALGSKHSVTRFVFGFSATAHLSCAAYQIISSFQTKIVESPVVVIGAGPIGLTAALIAQKKKLKTIIIDSESETRALFRQQQLLIQSDARKRLEELGLDFETVNDKCCKYEKNTFIAVKDLQQLILTKISEKPLWGHSLEEVDDNCLLLDNNAIMFPERIKLQNIHIVIIATGGRDFTTPGQLGWSNVQFLEEEMSNPTWASVTTVERSKEPDLCRKPILSNNWRPNTQTTIDAPSLALRFFGSRKRIYIAIGCSQAVCKDNDEIQSMIELRCDPKNENKVNKMANMMITAFGEFKLSDEKPLMRQELSIDRPLFRVAIQARPTVTQFYKGMFVCLEGDAARRPNFLLGSGFNSALSALPSLEKIFDELKAGSSVSTFFKTKSEITAIRKMKEDTHQQILQHLREQTNIFHAMFTNIMH